MCSVLAWLDLGTPAGLVPAPAPGCDGDAGAAVARPLQQQRRTQRLTGLLCAAACVGYALGGMSGLSEYALPTNPGEAFKWPDVAAKHKVWAYWGYSGVTMRGI